MALFSPVKKPRTARAATLRPAPRMAGVLDATVRDRGALPRLLICAVAVVALLVVVEGWKAPFSYRQGTRAEHGVLSRVAFQRVSRFKTERAKADAVEQVPYIFVQDAKPFDALTTKLRTALTDIAQAKTVEDLQPETRAAFALTVPETAATPPAADNMNFDFQTLKVAVAPEGGGTGDRIDELIGQFQRFIAPVRKLGLLAPEQLKRHRITPNTDIAIVSAADRHLRTVVKPAAVDLTQVVTETGELGRSWAKFSDLSVMRTQLDKWLRSQLPITLHYDEAATTRERLDARQRIEAIIARHSRDGVVLPHPIDDDEAAVLESVTDSYIKGATLVEPGRLIDDEALAVLKAEYDAVEQLVPLPQRGLRVATVLGMLLVLSVLNGYYLVRNEPRLVGSTRRVTVYLLVMVLAVALGRMLSYDPWRAEVVPLLVAVMIFAVAYDQTLAALTALTLSLVLTLSTRADLVQFVVLMSVAATALIPLGHVPSRVTLIKVGFWSAMVFFLVTAGLGIVRTQSLAEMWGNTALMLRSLRGAFWCLVAGYLVAGSLPFVEKLFGVVTDISLLEMSDVSHPLLQELARRAPGTYNHSMTVASIAETAADRIGANGLLARVGAYFHDIGKMLKPQYFVENMTKGAESRHDHLAPAMSTLIIIGHVKDGVDLARQHNLPRPLIDFIEQHHGTTLVEYFFNAARGQADAQPDHRTDADESLFRYPGPKPQTKETGVLMLSDAVESASRTLSDPTPKRIESLVHSITLKRLLDGQFDECDLKLSEIHAIEDSLIKSLIGIYHGRIKYPEQRSA